MTKQREKELHSLGFSAGNYANAYVSEDYLTAFNADRGYKEHEAYCAGFVLGFFASYEVYEIPSDCQEMFQYNYFSEHGQAIVEAGYCDHRHEHDWGECHPGNRDQI